MNRASAGRGHHLCLAWHRCWPAQCALQRRPRPHCRACASTPTRVALALLATAACHYVLACSSHRRCCRAASWTPARALPHTGRTCCWVPRCSSRCRCCLAHHAHAHTRTTLVDLAALPHRRVARYPGRAARCPCRTVLLLLTRHGCTCVGWLPNFSIAYVSAAMLCHCLP